MKKIIFLLVLSSVLLACNKRLDIKEEYTCEVKVLYPMPGVAFRGFSVADIDSAKVYRYKANTGFSELLGVDYVNLGGPPKMIHGIAFSFSNYHYETRGFFYVGIGTDYKVIIGDPAQEIIINDVRSGPTSKIVKQTTPCGGVELSPVSYDMKINGKDYIPERMEGGFYIILQP